MHGGRTLFSIEKSSEKLAVPAKKSSEKLAVAKFGTLQEKYGRERTSLLGRSPACSFHAWRMPTQQQNGVHFESILR